MEMALGTAKTLHMDSWTHEQAVSAHYETDERLVVRARSGDESAMEELFHRYRQPVFRFVYRMAGNQDDAEDITQDVFVRVFEHLHTFREECKFSTWIMKIAANLCTDRARTRQRQAQLLQQQATTRLDWMTHPHPVDPLEYAHREQVQAIFHRVLDTLPEHHRTILILRDLEEMPYEDIARILGCSIGGAKLRVLRARRALKARLAPYLQQIGEIQDVDV